MKIIISRINLVDLYFVAIYVNTKNFKHIEFMGRFLCAV